MADELMVWRLVKVAVISRLVVFALQVLFNFLVADYDSSSDIERNRTEILAFAFNGFRKWDAVYFLGIASDGYRYEQYMAFFPFYPWIIRFVSSLAYPCLSGVVEFNTILLTVGTLITWTSFVFGAVFLYKLSSLVLKDNTTAYIATVLFCINPASVFMSSCYTESLFACCLFGGLYFLEQSDMFWHLLLSSIMFALGTASRSNGILLCGFITHSVLKSTVLKILPQVKIMSVASALVALMETLLKLVILNSVVLAPFVGYQWYGYTLYCHSNGSAPVPQWCHKTLPTSYSYIQNQYWDVGFLRYFEPKQIPNFLLASPMLVLCLVSVVWYFKSQDRVTVQTLGLWSYWENGNTAAFSNKSAVYNPTLFVYMAHLLFLVGFGFTSMHVQVATRLISSSSPALYWFAADMVISHLSPSSNRLSPTYPSWLGKFVIHYFLIYFVIGIALHCNFYPWT